MILTELKIHSLRNISSAHLKLNPRFNVLVGPNGSGKTSILEALYLLSCGHSFRSREISPIVMHDKSDLTVFARAEQEQTISIQKSKSQPTQIKLNSSSCNSTSQLAYALPCQIFYSDIFQIIDAGSSVRRSLLDWGLFHVKHNYLSLLKDYKKILKQRNALLKTHAPLSQFIPWNKQLSLIADQLDVMRKEYFINWQDAFRKVLGELTDVHCTVNYYKGWDRKNTGKTLDEILTENFNSDLLKSFTQYGAHQADIIIETEDTKAKQVLSRGQQKIILISLKLAQAELLQKECLYLIDDLAAELDEGHQKRLLDYLSQRTGQYVITSSGFSQITTFFSQRDSCFFQIDKGSISQSVQNLDTINVSRETLIS